ncbi:FAD-dependent oxidoreductase [bacterium]|nr:FAD-dependent oxidoreductase [bacterium]
MNDSYDVVIAGGGVVGLCSAYYLQKTGVSVLIVDRGRYSEAASTGNAGMIVPSHIVPLSAPGVIAKGLKWLMNPESPLYIKPSANPKFMKWLWLFQKHCTAEHVARSIPILRDLSLMSRDLFSDVCALPGFEEVGLAHDGLLMLHRSDYAKKDNLELADLAENAGLEISRLSAQETMDLEPALKSELTGSVFFKQDASIHPERFMRALESHLRAAGVHFLDAEVKSFERSGGAVHAVGTTKGRFSSKHVVLAAGSWSPFLASKLGSAIAVQPAKGYSITVPVSEPSLKIPCILTDEKVTITPMPGCLRFGGTLALQGYDNSIDERRASPIRRLAETYCDGVDKVVDKVPTWAGFRPASPDGLPFIGALPAAPNVFAATGHGMMGVTLGPVTGKLISELIGGGPASLDVAPFASDRH